MSISTYASYKAKIANPWLNVMQNKLNFSAVGQIAFSSWLIAQDAGAAPTTAAVPDRTTAGAISYPGLFNSGGTMRLGRVSANCGGSVMWWLCDRLSHQGGLSGTATGAQTTNLPTAALTRSTGGVGVMIGLEVYTAVGATGTTITASYTNSAGTAARATEAVTWGGTGFREINRLVLLPLQSGDVGVKSVENVNAVGTTGTIGNFGVTLFKPLFAFMTQTGINQNVLADGLLSCGGGMIPAIPADACLWWVAQGMPGGTTDTTFNVRIIEE